MFRPMGLDEIGGETIETEGGKSSTGRADSPERAVEAERRQLRRCRALPPPHHARCVRV